MVTKKYW